MTTPEQEGADVEFLSGPQPFGSPHHPVEMAECPLCHTEDVSGDLRTLRIGCGYDLSEVSDLLQPTEALVRGVGRPLPMWSIRICKSCRGDFIGLLRQFINTQLATATAREVEEMNPERNIPVRVDGRCIMMTEPEWRHFRATGVPPVL